MTNLKTVASTVGILCFAAASLASEEVKTKMQIEVIGDDSDGAFLIKLDSDDMGCNLHDMQIGENRSIVDESGKSILVTRTESGFEFDVDGETIEMPMFAGDHHRAMWVGDGHGEDVNVHVMKDMDFTAAANLDGIMIMSGKPIDAATQQAIKSLLESAGHGSEVNFVDHEQHLGGGEHHVKMIQKRVHKTQ